LQLIAGKQIVNKIWWGLVTFKLIECPAQRKGCRAKYQNSATLTAELRHVDQVRQLID